MSAPIIRTTGQYSGGTAYPAQDCTGRYSVHFSHAYMATFVIGVGTTVYAQYWQRVAPHPDGTGQGLTDGLEFTITP